MESLEIGGLKLEPYAYAEKFENNCLLIDEVKVAVHGTAEAELRHMAETADYYPVARIGIDSKPREMRFGQILWSEHEGETKFKFGLVEKCYDESKPSPWSQLLEPQFSNMVKIVSQDSELIKELLVVLDKRGILKPGDVEKIKTKSQESAGNSRRLFGRVENVDEW